MTEEVAKITDLLAKNRPACIGVAVSLEQQGMTTTNAYIFVMAASHGNLDVTVPEEKAGDRVCDSSLLSHTEVTRPAAAMFAGAMHRAEHYVADLMSKQQTR